MNSDKIALLKELANDWKDIAADMRQMICRSKVSKASAYDAQGRAHAYDEAAKDLLELIEKLNKEG